MNNFIIAKNIFIQNSQLSQLKWLTHSVLQIFYNLIVEVTSKIILGIKSMLRTVTKKKVIR